MKIKTDVNTLCKVWDLLDELGITGMMEGKSFEYSPYKIFKQLLGDRKLNEFIEIISDANPDELTVSEAVETINNFFTNMAGELRDLQKLGIQLKPKENQPNKDSIPSGKSNTAFPESE